MIESLHFGNPSVENISSLFCIILNNSSQDILLGHKRRKREKDMHRMLLKYRTLLVYRGSLPQGCNQLLSILLICVRMNGIKENLMPSIICVKQYYLGNISANTCQSSLDLTSMVSVINVMKRDNRIVS